jgi:hypothetical protein
MITDTPDPNATNIGPTTYVANGQSVVFNHWGDNFGNAPGIMNGYPTWGGGKHLQLMDQFNGQGITQMQGARITKYAAGDVAWSYVYNYSDGGAYGYSDEGIEGESIQTGENPDFFHGTVGGNSSMGTRTLTLSAVAMQRSATTSGSYILDISQAWNSGNPVTITGLSGSVYNLANWPNVVTIPIDTSVLQSSAFGPVKCGQDTTSTNPLVRAGDMQMTNPNNPLDLKTAHCMVTVTGGSSLAGPSPGFRNGYAILSGDFPEGVTISNTGVFTGGTQSMDITYRNPHGGEFPVPAIGQPSITPGKYTMVWQGQSTGSGTDGYQPNDVTGMFFSYDTYTAANGIGMKLITRIYGAVDSKHIAVGASNIQGPPNPYEAPIIIASGASGVISQDGTTVTARIPVNSNIYKFRNRSQIEIAGCTTAGISGHGTNPIVDFSNNTISWTTSAAPNSGQVCNGDTVTVQMPDTEYQAHIYPGAAPLGPSVTAPATVTLEPNQVNWNAGDVLEEPHHPMMSSEVDQMVHTIYNATPGKPRTYGEVFAVNGAGVSSTYRLKRFSIANPCSIYRGCGGTLEPVPYMQLDGGGSSTGPNAGAIALGTAPLNQNPIFKVGCVPNEIGGCSNKDEVFWAANGQAHSYLGWYPDSGEWNVWGLALGVENGVKGKAGMNNSATRYNGWLRTGSVWIQGFEDFTNSAGAMGSITFTKDGSTASSRFGYCNHNDNPIYISLGICTLPSIGSPVVDGGLRVNLFQAQGASTIAGINVSPAIPPAPTVTYTGTAGSINRIYVITYRTPLGLDSLPSASVTSTNTASVLDGSNFVTVTCPTIPPNAPAGSSLHVFTAINGALGSTRDLDNCSGGIVKDNGTKTVTQSSFPSRNAALTIAAGQLQTTKGIAFPVDDLLVDGVDVYLSRVSALTIGVGTSVGASNASISAANFIGSGKQLTNLNASSLTDGIVPVGQLPIFTAGIAGIVPASGGSAANFLSADGTWKIPPTGSTNPTIVGIQKWTGSNWSGAAYSDIVSLWSSCGGNYLKGDGTCDAGSNGIDLYWEQSTGCSSGSSIGNVCNGSVQLPAAMPDPNYNLICTPVATAGGSYTLTRSASSLPTSSGASISYEIGTLTGSAGSQIITATCHAHHN